MKILYLTHLDWEWNPEPTLPIGATFDIKKIDKIPYNLLFNGLLFKTYLKLKGLDLDYDIIHYVTDRGNFIRATDSNLRGRHNRILGKSYCRSFIREGWEVYFIEGKDTAKDKRRGGHMSQETYTPLHENLHAKSDILGKEDKLHEWIALGKFNDYDSEYLGQKRPRGLLPKIKRDRDLFFKEAKRILDLDLRMTSGFRSFKEQDELYAQGRTKEGNIVTNAKGGESQHNYGIAFDVVDRYRGYNLGKDWYLLALLWHRIGGKHTGWGGLWKSFIDKPHFYNDMGYSLKDFQDNKVDYGQFN